MIFGFLRLCSAGCIVLFTSVGFAQLSAPAQQLIDPTSELRRQQERDNAARQRQESRPEKLPSQGEAASQARLPLKETPCFDIQNIQLVGGQAEKFNWVLNQLSGPDASDNPLGQCLGAEGINIVLKRAQDALLAQGFVTSRVLAEPQDLKPGLLKLTLIPGRIRKIRFAEGTTARAFAGNAVPTKAGDILNLRDIEPGYSDLVISYSQANPFRVSVSVDDSGSKGTGKYQGGLTVSYDNWWTINDLFYITFNRDLGGADVGPRGTKGRTVHYSVPWGYWSFSGTASSSGYFQTVAGANQSYVYSGVSANTEIKASRLVYRDAQRKITLATRGFQRKSNNFIDDTEVLVQQRKVGGWEASLGYKQYLGQASIDGNIAYKRGTGAFGSLVAPEEAFGEGTSRFALVATDVNLTAPFTVGDIKFKLNSAWRSQLQRTPLTPQDRFSIGGRFSVRGFDGDSSLSAERGWTLRNEISTNIADSGQDIFLAVDHGHVAGPSSDKLLGRNLTGYAVGLRGAIKKLQYDLFVGAPISKPDGFKTASTTAGINLNFGF
jgi:hemolysin activation/secretion protein